MSGSFPALQLRVRNDREIALVGEWGYLAIAQVWKGRA